MFILPHRAQPLHLTDDTELMSHNRCVRRLEACQRIGPARYVQGIRTIMPRSSLTYFDYSPH